jgi:hypothetical protein
MGTLKTNANLRLAAQRRTGITYLGRVLALWEGRLSEDEAEFIRCVLDRAVGFCSPQNRMFPELPYTTGDERPNPRES